MQEKRRESLGIRKHVLWFHRTVQREYHKKTPMESKYHVFAQDSENVELKIAYFPRLPFLLLGETALACISDTLDMFRVVSRYDIRRACMASDNSKMQCAAYQRYGNTRSFGD